MTDGIIQPGFAAGIDDGVSGRYEEKRRMTSALAATKGAGDKDRVGLAKPPWLFCGSLKHAARKLRDAQSLC